jgi:hypothetical protein
MYKPLILIVLLLGSSFAVLDVSSIGTDEEEQFEIEEEKPRQLAINYIPFKEVVTIWIDRVGYEGIDNIKKSYSLLSKDPKDFQIPDSLEAKILNETRIATIVYTNTEECAPGVIDATCIMINIRYGEVEGDGLKEKKKVAREIGNSVIDDINQALGTHVKYHSTVIDTAGGSSTEGPIINVVYTMYHLPAKMLFNIMILENIREEIRNAGGFFNSAKALSLDENSVFIFSMSPEKNRILYSLHISVTSWDTEIPINNFSPLDLFHEDKLNRSGLFAGGFYPMNSIVNVIVFSEEELQVLKANSSIIGSASNADELQKNGWYFISSTSEPSNGINKLDLRYLFGKTNSVDRQQLLLSIVPIVEDVTSNNAAEETNQGGGCLIATAAFGSEMAPQVQFLRELRDNTVLQTESGASFMTGFNQFYYSFSPYIADYERENPAFKETVKIALTPLLTSLTLLQYTDIDSESEMLGYGIGIILLNIGMYFVAPAVLVMKIRKLV